ncbi:uncharacterized protein BO95DRAFT_427291 [Aspergillus brunneoviolaceus CBS 621.78]|uniref:Uncharacterized protein n=1 Tax=Aspergillus brunneoviolaceus CBS 621.78 TaxID=1450534 RepID=A0ACD1GP83_9EURO|nr:hypothetical protein BO95DRAFT_427291 [Aspergillus brunneoviolaceus CBS 621.78]RAH50932.1 hypothetical protein BO95DRAFT_427291 [Aspergillus brunneoviolaceus CBS 621.78]
MLTGSHLDAARVGLAKHCPVMTECARHGIHLIVALLPNPSSQHLSAKGITFFPLDVTVEGSVVELKARIRELAGEYLDILVHCADVNQLDASKLTESLRIR